MKNEKITDSKIALIISKLPQTFLLKDVKDTLFPDDILYKTALNLLHRLEELKLVTKVSRRYVKSSTKPEKGGYVQVYKKAPEEISIFVNEIIGYGDCSDDQLPF